MKNRVGRGGGGGERERERENFQYWLGSRNWKMCFQIATISFLLYLRSKRFFSVFLLYICYGFDAIFVYLFDIFYLFAQTDLILKKVLNYQYMAILLYYFLPPVGLHSPPKLQRSLRGLSLCSSKIFVLNISRKQITKAVCDNIDTRKLSITIHQFLNLQKAIVLTTSLLRVCLPKAKIHSFTSLDQRTK